MKQKLLIITAILMAMNLSAPGAAKKNEVRLIDMSRVLSAYGFKGGVFETTSRVAVDLSKSCDEKIPSIEGDDLLIDSPEEFFTAAYFSTVKISKNKQSIINKELPKDKAPCGCVQCG